MTAINLLLTAPVCMHVKLFQSCLTLCDPMDHACQVPQPMGFSRQTGELKRIYLPMGNS